MTDRRWGFLEMYRLLNEDVVRFLAIDDEEYRMWRVSSNKRIGLPELLVSLLVSRCPVCCKT